MVEVSGGLYWGQGGTDEWWMGWVENSGNLGLRGNMQRLCIVWLGSDIIIKCGWSRLESCKAMRVVAVLEKLTQ